MSSPSDPFGRGDRTIIVPNPAGRRPGPDTLSPQAPQASSPAYPPPGYGAPPEPGRQGQPSAADAWSSTAAPPPPPPPAERGRALVLKRDIVVAPNQNPYLKAAGPLLLLFGRLRVQLSRASFANLMEQVASAIEDFEADARAAGAPAEQTRTAKYIVCATADDVVQNIPTDERHVWTQYSMLSRFFGERTGGVRFFEELDRAKVDPHGTYNLLELQYACLAMGFQGIHRTSAGGAATLQQIQRNLYEMLRRTRPANREVSPRWQGRSLAAAIAQFQVPLWAIGSVVAVLLLGFYILLRFMLAGSTEAAATALVSVHPATELGIQRRIYTPPPPPPPPPPTSPTAKLRSALQDEIASQKISVSEAGNTIVVRIAAALFPPGDAAVKPEFRTLIERLAKLLDGQPGGIKVVGHTDSAPIKNVRFPSNFHLSLERAKAVGQVMKAGLARPERVEVEGKGADVPIAPNDSPDGRARNRRVEILIPRGG
ncbi:type VI secretion system protein TssL, long form [Methylobacterium segetis]|uniref:type VI secretion system protein TssL, long form n=1 Tax=Methylobacterium segetis TaxID=2488750 RepID=UPI00104EBE22|nr:type VI secretion system protein TssL, long form [Methylobacterium segetis]